MVLLESKICGVFKIRRYFFPTRDEAEKIAFSLRPFSIARLVGSLATLDSDRIAKHETCLTSWVDLSGGLGEVYQRMDKTSCRYEIRRAEKLIDRVTIEQDTDRAKRDFLRLYNDFVHAYSRQFGATRSPPYLHRRTYEYYQQVCSVLVLYLDDSPICGDVVMFDTHGGRALGLYGASRRLDDVRAAQVSGALTRYLQWHEFRICIDNGISIFDLGGISGQREALTRYKLSFGGRPVELNYYTLATSRNLARLANRAVDAARRVAGAQLRRHEENRRRFNAEGGRDLDGGDKS